MGCAYYFFLSTLFLFDFSFWSNVQLRHLIVSWFNVWSPVHEVLNWKSSTEHYRGFFLSISYKRKRRLIRTSSSYVRVVSDATAPTSIIVTIYCRFSRKENISRFLHNITPRTNSFYVVQRLLYVLGSVSTFSCAGNFVREDNYESAGKCNEKNIKTYPTKNNRLALVIIRKLLFAW